MPDSTEGTEAQVPEAQRTESVVTQDLQSLVTTLQSRNAGLDSKVTSLLGEKKSLEAQLAEATKARDDALKGVTDKDAAASAQVAELQKRLDAALVEAKVGKLAAAFPETYGVFGDSIASMTPEALAAAEARFTGAKDSGNDEPETPPAKPVGNAGTRTLGKPEPSTWEEKKAALKGDLGAQFEQDWAEA